MQQWHTGCATEGLQPRESMLSWQCTAIRLHAKTCAKRHHQPRALMWLGITS